MKKYIALIGDLVDSRHIPNRIEFDNSLLNLLNTLSIENPGIKSPYTLIGDEIQAVYTNSELLFRDAFRILALIYPQKMRFSFGIGELIKPINPKQAIEMDGPAFYAARDGIDELKKKKMLFNINGDQIKYIRLLKEILFYLSDDVTSWNSTRIKTFSYKLQDYEVKEIANTLHSAKTTIYKTINEGRLESVRKILDEISKNL